MERFTHKSHWPDGHWTVPLVQFCDENGKLPQDGQFVPQAVIDRLAAYEDAENKPEIVRCRDCVHGRYKHQDMTECIHDADLDEHGFVESGFTEWHDPNFFCAYGERKENTP